METHLPNKFQIVTAMGWHN